MAGRHVHTNREKGGGGRKGAHGRLGGGEHQDWEGGLSTCSFTMGVLMGLGFCMTVCRDPPGRVMPLMYELAHS